MQEQTYELTDEAHPLVDVDVMPGGEPVCVVCEGNGFACLLYGERFALPESIRFPRIRAIDHERLIIANARTEHYVPNAWIFGIDGREHATVRLDDAIQDIVCFPGYTAVGYFDEGFGNPDELFGLVVFDSHWQPCWHDPTVDIYCACARSDQHLLYVPYPELTIRQLDLTTMTMIEWSAPEQIRGASAMTCIGNDAYFTGTYHHREDLYHWEIGSSSVEKVGEYTARLRGLRNGRFLAFGTTGCTILSVE